MNLKWIGLALLALAAVGCIAVKAADGLVWDAITKHYEPNLGEDSLPVSFRFTNTSKSEIVINSVSPSCGCTAVKLPTMPWRLPPGTNGVLEATIDLVNKPGGLNIKTITVQSSEGLMELRIEVVIPEDARAANMRLAQQNRQAVFEHGPGPKEQDCASCHAPESAKTKRGAELFALVCANCHESKNRAPSVPDLGVLPIVTTREFWRNAVAKGKERTMMPAFSKSESGPLDDEQIQSLVDYLSRRYLPKLEIDYGSPFGPAGQIGTPGVSR